MAIRLFLWLTLLSSVALEQTKVSALPELAETPAGDDVAVIVDTSTLTTKKITIANFLDAFATDIATLEASIGGYDFNNAANLTTGDLAAARMATNFVSAATTAALNYTDIAGSVPLVGVLSVHYIDGMTNDYIAVPTEDALTISGNPTCVTNAGTANVVVYQSDSPFSNVNPVTLVTITGCSSTEGGTVPTLATIATGKFIRYVFSSLLAAGKQILGATARRITSTCLASQIRPTWTSAQMPSSPY